MSVRQCLLAILDQGPCYGYQLRAELDRRTGSTWALNVGQVYNTLERLERDGLVVKGGTDDQGHVLYEITDAGRDAVGDWLNLPVVRAPSASADELAMKLAIAATLPGVDVSRVIRTQRAASMAALQNLAAAKRASHTPVDATDIAGTLVLDAFEFRAEAEVRWLDHVQSVLENATQEIRDGVHLDTRPAKRGRPAKAEASDGVPVPATA